MSGVEHRIEQLFYTSSIGKAGKTIGGVRLRAVSDGLTEADSMRVQKLDGFLRYVLPKGVDSFTITPDHAPTCLALMQTNEGEQFLLNKLYTGRDEFGRPGAYFIHALVGFPDTFTVQDAILLWRSPFWQTSDVSIGNSTHLPAVPRDALSEAGCSGRYRGKYEGPQFKLCPGNPPVHTGQPDFASIQPYLSFVIQAYLTRKPGQQLYIAAPIDVVADLIFGLTRCLPRPLLKDLTFSTYENDIQDKDEFLLVGTCWDSSVLAGQDLPEKCYLQHLAFNSYTAKHSRLVDEPRAASFAGYATKCLVTNSFTTLDRLIGELERTSDLNVPTFLQYYLFTVEQVRQPTRESIEFMLSRPDLAARQLFHEHVQASIIEQALAEPERVKTVVIPGLKSLFSVRDRYPGLADALFRLAQYTSQQAAEAANQGNAARFDSLLDIVVCIADSRSEVWRMQPRIFAQQPNMQRFLSTYPQEHFRLLKLWAQVQPRIDGASIRPFLQVAEDDFKQLTKLDLPSEWYAIAVEELIVSVLSAERDARHLGIQHERLIESFLRHRINTSWAEAERLYVFLAHKHYPHMLRLLSILLKSPESAGKLTPLLRKAPLEPGELEEFLTEYGPKYLPQPQEEITILDLFDKLATYSQPSKITVLNSWLKSSDNRAQLPALAAWFDAPANMDKVLTRAQLTSDESERFLEVYGAYYLGGYISRYKSPASHVIVEYIRQYLQNIKPENPDEHSFFRFLSSGGVLQSLPRDLQAEVNKGFDLQRFLQKPSLAVRDLRELGNIIYRMSPETRSELVEVLASAFASCVENETQLSAVVFAMSVSLTKPALLQMLDEMAIIVRGSVAAPDAEQQQRYKALLKSYIRFALCFDSVYDLPHDELASFVQTFLDTLLESTDDRAVQQLDIGASGKVLQRWQEYLKQSQRFALENKLDENASLSVNEIRPIRSPVESSKSGGSYQVAKPTKDFLQPDLPRPQQGSEDWLIKSIRSSIMKLTDWLHGKPLPNTSMRNKKEKR